eukprot:TRINITY_DN4670_c0_g1_i1.p2 TRINITY_DN4670_c0_g1~~TRINITY_DN4670_c0_g1_i1.p2  ORF type:complete len:102 (+),score=3.04 TRINITY_DN4670_c0_g1_i1:128-433(+)
MSLAADQCVAQSEPATVMAKRMCCATAAQKGTTIRNVQQYTDTNLSSSLGHSNSSLFQLGLIKGTRASRHKHPFYAIHHPDAAVWPAPTSSQAHIRVRAAT